MQVFMSSFEETKEEERCNSAVTMRLDVELLQKGSTESDDYGVSEDTSDMDPDSAEFWAQLFLKPTRDRKLQKTLDVVETTATVALCAKPGKVELRCRDSNVFALECASENYEIMMKRSALRKNNEVFLSPPSAEQMMDAPHSAAQMIDAPHSAEYLANVPTTTECTSDALSSVEIMLDMPSAEHLSNVSQNTDPGDECTLDVSTAAVLSLNVPTTDEQMLDLPTNVVLLSDTTPSVEQMTDMTTVVLSSDTLQSVEYSLDAPRSAEHLLNGSLDVEYLLNEPMGAVHLMETQPSDEYLLDVPGAEADVRVRDSDKCAQMRKEIMTNANALRKGYILSMEKVTSDRKLLAENMWKDVDCTEKLTVVRHRLDEGRDVLDDWLALCKCHAREPLSQICAETRYCVETAIRRDSGPPLSNFYTALIQSLTFITCDSAEVLRIVSATSCEQLIACVSMCCEILFLKRDNHWLVAALYDGGHLSDVLTTCFCEKTGSESMECMGSAEAFELKFPSDVYSNNDDCTDSVFQGDEYKETTVPLTLKKRRTERTRVPRMWTSYVDDDVFYVNQSMRSKRLFARNKQCQQKCWWKLRLKWKLGSNRTDVVRLGAGHNLLWHGLALVPRN